MIKPELEFVYEAGGELEAPRQIGTTDDGTLIQIRNKGPRRGPPEVMERLVKGEDVDPSEYYFRTVPEFVVPADAQRLP